MQNSQRQINRMGKDLQKVGKNLSVSITAPLIGLGGLAVKAAADMETLKTSIDTVFQGNQQLSTQAFEDIKEFAAKTPFQLEEVANAFIKLKNLGLDPSQEALTSYGNTASALGKSLDQMIEAVADASVGEFERLKEFGIKAKSQGDDVSFTFQGVTTTVKKNSEEISAYLQDIGNVNFAGSIDRQANTFNGKLSTLKDNLTQAFASIGSIIIDYISPLFEKLNGILKSFQELSPSTKKWIVILGGIAAAIGPLLALAGTILPAIGTGLALLTGPIGLIVAGLTAVGIVIYKNWAPIKKTLIDIANYFIDLYNESTVFRIGVEAVVAQFKIMWEIGKFAFEGIKSLLIGLKDSFVSNFKTIGDIFKAVLTGNIKELPKIIKAATGEGKKNFSNLTDNLNTDWKNLISGIEKVTNDGLANITTRKKLAYLKENVDASAITEAVSDATKKGLAKGVTGGTGVSVEAEAPEAFDNAGLDQFLTEHGAKIDEAKADASGQSFIGIMAESMDRDLEPVQASLTDFQERMLEFQTASASIMQGVAQNFTEGFANVVVGLATGAVGFGAVGGLILSTMGDLATHLGKSAIKIGLAMKAIKLSFSSPLGAIVAGTGLLVVGALLKNLAGNFGGGDAGAFATGGIVGGSSYYGDKLFARVNSGEAIFNQEQQKRLYNLTEQASGPVDVKVGGSVVIDGAKLRIVLDRYDKRNSRLG